MFKKVFAIALLSSSVATVSAVEVSCNKCVIASHVLVPARNAAVNGASACVNGVKKGAKAVKDTVVQHPYVVAVGLYALAHQAAFDDVKVVGPRYKSVKKSANELGRNLDLPAKFACWFFKRTGLGKFVFAAKSAPRAAAASASSAKAE